MEKDEHITPVLFRVHRSPKKHGDAVTAVFPTVPWSWSEMSCYEHVGQHGACCYGWYLQTRPATPEEYAALKHELESEFGYNLKVYQKITPKMRKEFDAELRRMRDGGSPV